MFQTKYITTPLTLKAPGDGPEGRVSAVFSTFGVVDRDGDVVLPSAIKSGQPVPMVWCHDWSHPIGRGQLDVTPNEAIFNGQFFMDTERGSEAFKTVKAMSDLQEWSWGFRVLAGDPGMQDGQDVFYIRETEVFEVSPVLVGAGMDTHTTAIKGHSMDYERHADYVQESIRELIERTKAGSATRAHDGKSGRAISEARRTRMADVSGSLRSAADEIDAMLKETEPAKVLAPSQLFAEFQRIQATLNGVAIGSN